jgi:hypothetical protein
VLAPPWNARTRVHEYGGGAWTASDDRLLVFAEFSDQRLYRLDPGATEPVALTPAPQIECGIRYAQLSITGVEVWAIRETHAAGGSVRRDICAVPLEGSATEDGSLTRSIVAGSQFLAHPRI